MTVDRHLALEGALNARDIGGYRTASGHTVRWGQIYRSASLAHLTAHDLTTLEDLGVRVVYDLRARQEYESAPSILPVGVRRESLPIGGTGAELAGLSDLYVDGKLAAAVPDDFLSRIYAAMIEQAAPTFGRLLTNLSDSAELPALFHCTAGKDRTGLSAALLLTVLGVDEELILDDYTLSAEFYSAPQLAKARERGGSGVDSDRLRIVHGAPRETMANALAALRNRYGSVEGYLTAAAGVDPVVFDRLRRQLLI